MAKHDTTGGEKLTASRRKFLTAGGAALAGTAAAVAMPHVARAQTKTLKVQAAWGGGIFLENAKVLRFACARDGR